MLTETHLLLGGVRPLSLERHAEDRLVSSAYVEEAHHLSVDHVRTLRTRGWGDRHVQARELVRLPRDVTPTAAQALARRVRELRAR